ncbi:TonB-dependent receptor domain-containing protein [Stakelama tenebrarum]|uniref:TonB-dependent receptor n=1 Tax=Stakelama tenebrarum TaxID=2711215 RepID=A0A6G6Y831_9SPHN|nr:TonB-dependent receptor [Sphingosinithalassobacter tenebrarum]QIG80957.1 TonB-dependent receptor [Sphingosinithalassobacter tenebrarum]
MKKPLRLAHVLMFTTALVAPAVAHAQDAAGQEVSDTAQAPQDQEYESPDVSVPGGEIVVRTGAFNIEQDTAEVVSLLSAEDIARTGEGDIAGALSRVTGLSVVGNGFVYVRGLGDRYSLALLNGSPLPSPEPLKRVVPLDIFPTNVISSSLVQKTYSVNYPGEFGGGVINLTTKSVPEETFVTVSGSIGGDTFTTGNLGYVYRGSEQDWTGFDNGVRDIPPALQSFFDSGNRISDLSQDQREAIAEQLITGNNSVLQTNKNMAPNWSAGLTTGTAIDIGSDARLGIIATAGYSNKFRTRQTTQQSPASADLSLKELDFDRVITDEHVVVDGMLGFGLEFGEHRIRWTNLYIRDTLKQARLGVGTRATSASGATFMQQDTAWFERQLIDSQIVGEFKSPGDGLSVDWRLGYANSQREAPDEISFEYYRSNRANDPYGDLFINRLNNGQNGSASIAFSNLDEDLWSGGVDVSAELTPSITVSAGYAFADTERTSSRREFQFVAPNNGQNFPPAVLRPDLLLGDAIIDYYNINLIETTESDPAFEAKLRTDAGYFQFNAELAMGLSLNGGVRYETARQTVNPIEVFTVPSNSGASTSLQNEYWLPAATLTWEFADNMQLRVSGSKTIARPQFRELLFQQYYDPESNRLYRGNPSLQDSQLYNAEARVEWYTGRDQRVSAAGFFKRIDNPIETYTGFTDNVTETSFANAPEANLYGAELEAQKYFDAFGSRRIVAIANYTYTHSELKVGSGDTVEIYTSGTQPALNVFRDGVPLTGQSDHLVNVQLGLEDEDSLSAQTFLLSYASKRVTSRAPFGQPDIYEYPGVRLDFVARQGIYLGGIEAELKLEVRNILGTDYKEYQESGDNRIYYNLYEVGTSGSLGLSITF